MITFLKEYTDYCNMIFDDVNTGVVVGEWNVHLATGAKLIMRSNRNYISYQKSTVYMSVFKRAMIDTLNDWCSKLVLNSNLVLNISQGSKYARSKSSRTFGSTAAATEHDKIGLVALFI